MRVGLDVGVPASLGEQGEMVDAHLGHGGERPGALQAHLGGGAQVDDVPELELADQRVTSRSVSP